MKHDDPPVDCARFRQLLSRTLAADAQARSPLSWHRHLLTCELCRELLRTEEALEDLLATWPEPKLPPAVRERVLARLRGALAGERGLDALLELDRAARVPAEVRERLRARLSAEQTVEDRLERLLERDVVPPCPPELTRRVAARALQEARGASLRGRPARRPALLRRRLLLAAAAALVLVFGGERFLRSRTPVAEEALAGLGRDQEFLRSLEVLEHFDLLMDPDLDLVIASELEPQAVVLLEFAR